MPSPAHEVAVAVLAEQPELFALLLEILLGVRIEALERDDANVRFTRTVEVRPDLLFKRSGGAPLAVEVQNDRDEAKRRRWPTLLSVLNDGSEVAGDLVILTTSRAVAAWAREAAHVTGPLGTRMTVTPVVLLLTEEVIEKLLDEDHPALAFFAAWAMRERHGPEAQEVVRRAISVTEKLEPPLREAQQRAILQVLSEQMLARLKEVAMDVSKLPPETPLMREVREGYVALVSRARAEGKIEGQAEGEAKGKFEGKAEGEAKGKAEALLAVLTARGLLVPAAERARIAACSDLATLDRWIAQAVVAKSLDAALE